MTTYTISKSTEAWVLGVVHTLLHLEQFSIETLKEFLQDHCTDYRGEFIYATRELLNLEIIDTYYKFVDEDNFVELSKEQEDEADDVEVKCLCQMK